MSQENVEIVRAAYDAFNRGDVEASLAFLDEDVEWFDSPEVPGGGVHRGPEGVRRGFADWLGAWESYTAETEELIDARDQVLAAVTLRGRGKQSGVETSWDLWHLWTLRDSKGRARASIHEQGRSPRSRRTQGVGDVAGERGAVEGGAWRLQPGRAGGDHPSACS
jgi:ketosteroid isomerase-like protein